MRKFKHNFINIMITIILIIVFLSSEVAIAEGNDTEVIVDEETPEVADSSRHFWIAGYGLVFIIAIYYASIRSSDGDIFRLQITNIEDNGDGSYVVKVGYKNLTDKILSVDQNDSKIKMTKGTAIVLEKKDITDLPPSGSKELVTMAVGDDCNVEISVGKEIIIVDKDLLEEWRRKNAKRND